MSEHTINATDRDNAVAAGAMTDQTIAAVTRLNDAVNRHDIEALMAVFAVDCVFENPAPPPDGGRLEGHEAVRLFWQRWFARHPGARFDTEEIFATGDRCVVRWVYHKTRDGKPWHLRGVDLFRVRDGRVTEKLAYIKG
jgi:ketosteroid isomerase-like protein